MYNSGCEEWYTPPEIAEAARDVMGEIDLDPASCDLANTVIRAKKYYTLQDDGLKLKWYGRVWLNPPYSRGVVDKFISKAISDYLSGNISECIVLVNNATDARWFQGLAKAASAMCFLAGRCRFWGPSVQRSKPLQGQAVAYLGRNTERFLAVFCKFGFVVTVSRVDPGAK